MGSHRIQSQQDHTQNPQNTTDREGIEGIEDVSGGPAPASSLAGATPAVWPGTDVKADDHIVTQPDIGGGEHPEEIIIDLDMPDLPSQSGVAAVLPLASEPLPAVQRAGLDVQGDRQKKPRAKRSRPTPPAPVLPVLLICGTCQQHVAELSGDGHGHFRCANCVAADPVSTLPPPPPDGTGLASLIPGCMITWQGGDGQPRGPALVSDVVSADGRRWAWAALYGVSRWVQEGVIVSVEAPP